MMNKKEKIVAAFLVSIGMFSAMQAQAYVKALPDSEKNTLTQIVASAGQQVAGTGNPTEWPVNNKR